MKLQTNILANSLALLGGGYYLLCLLVAILAPDLYKLIAGSWMHGIDVIKVWRDTPLDITGMAIGFISFTISAWVTGYLLANIYNILSKNK